MKLSTKSRYAVRCMIALAESDHKTSISEISSQQEISERYLELIFSKLKKSGLVNSIRGSKGGYQLAKPAIDITIYDILEAVEKDMNIIKDVVEPTPMEAMLNDQIWQPTNHKIKNYLKSITLQSLLQS